MRTFLLRITSACLCACSIATFVAPAFAGYGNNEAGGFRDIQMTPKRNLESEARGEMRADASEMADLLNVRPYVERLRASKQSSPLSSPPSKPLLNAKMLCLWRIMIAGQEVRRMVADIDRDLANNYVALDSLTARRNNAQNFVNTLNFMQGGTLGIIKQSLFLHEKFHASQYPLLVSFSTGTGLALVNLLTPGLWFKKGEPEPNMLAHFFDLNYHPPDAGQSYLWKFFDAQFPGASNNLTRRQALIKHWHDFDGVNSESPAVQRKLASLPEGEHWDHIKTLSQRIDLLHDLKTHVEEIDGSLYELHKTISTY